MTLPDVPRASRHLRGLAQEDQEPYRHEPPVGQPCGRVSRCRPVLPPTEPALSPRGAQAVCQPPAAAPE